MTVATDVGYHPPSLRWRHWWRPCKAAISHSRIQDVSEHAVRPCTSSR